MAVTGCGPVGVDVEVLSDFDFRPALALACTAEEARRVLTTGDFYAYWTRKEAVLKAIGEGLNREMTDVAVSDPSHDARLLTLSGNRIACAMRDLPIPGYAATVAVLTGSAVDFTIEDANRLLAPHGGRTTAARPFRGPP